MVSQQVKKPIYDGNACMLYDYMVEQDLTEEDVSQLLQRYDGKTSRWPISTYIQNPISIPFYRIPGLCKVLNAPIEAVFMKSRILNE